MDKEYFLCFKKIKELDLSKDYECRDATQKTNSKLTSLTSQVHLIHIILTLQILNSIYIFNIPMQYPEKERGTRDRAFYFKEEGTLNFVSFLWRDLQ